MIPRESSADYGLLVRRAQEARAESRRQLERATRLGTEARHDQGHLLTNLTARLDWRREIPPGSAQRLARLSAAVGRDASIEQAKLMLRDRYQITGSQAFELLRQISQTSNRKVRDVARDLLAG
jgi:hypothetical protein